MATHCRSWVFFSFTGGRSGEGGCVDCGGGGSSSWRGGGGGAESAGTAGGGAWHKHNKRIKHIKHIKRIKHIRETGLGVACSELRGWHGS